MANYFGTARTNYFRVKNIETFMKSVKDYKVIVVKNDEGKVALLDDSYYGAFEFRLLNEETYEYDESTHLIDLVSSHLEEEEVAIFISAGAEKKVYISGFSIAVNSKNQRKTINLDNIYKKAKKLGKNITRAEC